MIRLPASTYRLQFNAAFTFVDAAALVPYLDRLGISHCYASPYLKARPGSSHGYDIVDHNAFNPEIGERDTFEAFVAALRDRGMGHILDLVPNHMGVFGSDNQWWLDVLENGPASAYAVYFDIDWRPQKEVLRGKVLLPVLGNHYGKVLEAGDLKLAFDVERGELSIWYWEHRFPLDPATYPVVLEAGMPGLLQQADPDDPAVQDLQALISAFGHLPPRWEGEDRQLERRRDKEVHKRHLAELYARAPMVAANIDRAVTAFNGTPGDSTTFTALHRLIERQAYRLAYWQVASDEINYRRFFDINDLAGLRIEESEVFADTHRLVLELIGEGKLDGLRIDHPDGLYDPLDYYRRLIDAGRHVMGLPPGHSDEPPPFYLVVEKILASYEHLPQQWPVHGTTGYDFANLVGGLFVYPDSEHDLDRMYVRFTGNRQPFDRLLYERKKLVIETQLSSELTVLGNLLDQLAQLDRQTRDFTLNGLRDALAVVVAGFPVYRTYIDGRRPISEEERRYVEWAIAKAKKLSPATDVSIFDFIRDLLLGEGPAADDGELARRATAFAMRFQQYTSPVMAKGLEDTVFYLYNRLVSLNEVGGDPRRYAVTVTAFHHTCQERRQRWPYAMLTTSTHDTKRSEDVRARITVLSEVPGDWQRNVGRWARLNRTKKVVVDESAAPSRNDEYMLYQTLVGAWPLLDPDDDELSRFRERICRYMLKAAREAKVNTSWINPNADYEAAIEHFVDQLLTDSGNRFLTDFRPFVRRVSRLGLFNALSQTVLKLTAPGIPDVYQGNELWQFDLVDPDNRHSVDYPLRQRLLDELASSEPSPGLARHLMENLHDGRIKLYTTWVLLNLRRALPQLLVEGTYQPLNTGGWRADYLCAFVRMADDVSMIVVTARWFSRLLTVADYPIGPSVWGDTHLLWPEELAGEWHNIFTGEVIAVKEETVAAADLFCDFPGVVLLREEVHRRPEP